MKYALVKQEVYADLYVASKEMSADEILFSSMGRVGPIGMFTMLDADFYIVKEDPASECKVWKKDGTKRDKVICEQAANVPLNNIPGQEFKRPGSQKVNSDYAVDVDTIDWSVYDVVISINISIPTRIVSKYPNVLWVHMDGEAGIMEDKAYFGYDVCLNQMTGGMYQKRRHVIDFPYTFVGPNDLENIVSKLFEGTGLVKKGIYGEINCVNERPVTRIPQLEPVSEKTGQPIRFHQQLIRDNLMEIYQSKYYVKLGGRMTRGNGVIESISLGTPVLMSPKDVIHAQLLPKEAWINSAEEAIEKIMFYDSHEDEYQRLLQKERDLLQQFVVDYPLYWLEEERKRKTQSNKTIKYNYHIDKAKKIVKKLL